LGLRKKRTIAHFVGQACKGAFSKDHRHKLVRHHKKNWVPAYAEILMIQFILH
jgi:hypothetical protein